MKIRNDIAAFALQAGIALLFFLLLASGIGQTNVVPAITDALPVPPGESPFGPAFWQGVIAAVTPVLVYLLRLMLPHMPKFVLPSVSPFIGVMLGLVLNWLATAGLSWVDSGLAGAAGVAVREIVHNTITQHLQTKPEEPKVLPPPT